MQPESDFLAAMFERFDALERGYRRSVVELLRARSTVELTRERINYIRRALRRRGIDTPQLAETSLADPAREA